MCGQQVTGVSDGVILADIERQFLLCTAHGNQVLKANPSARRIAFA